MGFSASFSEAISQEECQARIESFIEKLHQYWYGKKQIKKVVVVTGRAPSSIREAMETGADFIYHWRGGGRYALFLPGRKIQFRGSRHHSSETLGQWP